MNHKIKDLNCILLVDDDEFTNYVNQKIIEKAQIKTHVQLTTSAEEALDYLRERGHAPAPQPGIIFLDLNMPGMNGFEFLQEYDQFHDEQKAHIIVVVLTSSDHPHEMEKIKKNKDVVAFWTKPLRPQAVADLVDSHFINYERSDFN